MEALAKALEKMPKLTHLNMNAAGEMGERGTGIATQALVNSNCNLVELDMGKLYPVLTVSSFPFRATFTFNSPIPCMPCFQVIGP